MVLHGSSCGWTLALWSASNGQLPQHNRVMLEASGDAGGQHSGDRVGEMSHPSYVLAVDEVIFVSEFWDNRVVQLRPGSPASVFTAGGGLDGPWGLVVVGDVLFVASFATDRIHRYNITTTEPLGLFGSENELDCPEGIAVDSNGTLYVASFLTDSIAKYSTAGQFLGHLVVPGLRGPEDVAVLPNNDILVTSHDSDEIFRVSPDGASVEVFASIESPVGLTVGLDGNVYAASYQKHAIVRYDGRTGAFIDLFATGGYLQGPSSLSFATARLLYVTSYENNRLVLYNASTRLSIRYTFGAHQREFVSA